MENSDENMASDQEIQSELPPNPPQASFCQPNISPNIGSKGDQVPSTSLQPSASASANSGKNQTIEQEPQQELPSSNPPQTSLPQPSGNLNVVATAVPNSNSIGGQMSLNDLVNFLLPPALSEWLLQSGYLNQRRLGVPNFNPMVHYRPIAPRPTPLVPRQSIPAPVGVGNHEQSQPLDFSSTAPAILPHPSNYIRHPTYPPPRNHTGPSANNPPQIYIQTPYIEPPNTTYSFPVSSCPFNNFRYGTGIFPGVPPPIESDPEFENEQFLRNRVPCYPPPPPAHTTPHQPPRIVFPHPQWFSSTAHFDYPPRW